MSAISSITPSEGVVPYSASGGITVHLADTRSTWITSLEMLESAKCVAMDCEGVKLCRDGELCIIQVVDEARPKVVHLFDFVKLTEVAPFDIATGTGYSLRTLCESDTVQKLFWDVRCDSDAMYNNKSFRVQLRNVIDLQVLQAVRMLHTDGGIRFLPGLAKTMDVLKSRFPNPDDVRKHVAIKDKARPIFAPEHGGSYEVWRDDRPLPAVLIDYCTDCTFFFALRSVIETGLRYDADVVTRIVANRIRLAEDPKFVGRGKHMAVPDKLLSSA